MSRIGTRNEKGMTLTELLVVVALIGIVAVIAIPNFNAMLKSHQASTAVSEMVSMINLARQLSVSRRDSHIFLAFNTGRWELRNVASTELLRSADMPDNMTVVAFAAFAFDANGACTNPTTYSGTTPNTQYIRVEAVVSSARTDRYTLEVSPVGRVKSTKEIL